MLCELCGKEISDKEKSCPFCGHMVDTFSDFEEWDDPERYLPEDDLESQIGLHMPKIVFWIAAIAAFGIFIASAVIYVRGTDWETPLEGAGTVKLPDKAMTVQEYQEKYFGSGEGTPAVGDDGKPIVLEERQDVIERMIKNGNDAKTAVNLPPMPTISLLEPTAYILPNSNSEYLKEKDLSWMSLDLAIHAKEEIYARHGKRFNEYRIQGYFNTKSWYQGLYSPEEFSALGDVLNQYEKKNLQLLNELIEELKEKEAKKEKKDKPKKDKPKDKQ